MQTAQGSVDDSKLIKMSNGIAQILGIGTTTTMPLQDMLQGGFVRQFAGILHMIMRSRVGVGAHHACANARGDPSGEYTPGSPSPGE